MGFHSNFVCPNLTINDSVLEKIVNFNFLRLLNCSNGIDILIMLLEKCQELAVSGILKYWLFGDASTNVAKLYLLEKKMNQITTYNSYRAHTEYVLN